jgi:PTH2 family peptidyl-tRNA hydrolase
MLKQTFIINSDLDMGKGKIAVQVAHGEVLYMEYIQFLIVKFDEEGPDNVLVRYLDWRAGEIEPIGMMKKVVLKESEKEMKRILQELGDRKIKSFSVYDKGITQVESNSFTCICVEPIEEAVSNELFGHLKLL